MGTSRAAALLESLSGRDAGDAILRRSGGPAGRRLSTPTSDDAIGDHASGRSGVAGSPLRILVDRLPSVRRLPPVVLLVLVVAGITAWWFLAAPAPLEDRMRDVSASDATTADGLLDRSDRTGPAADAAGSSADVTSRDPTGANGSDDGVIVDIPERITVHVAGAVVSPGVVDLPVGGRVNDAIAAAGGLRAEADPDRLNLAAELGDGSRILVPVQGQELFDEVVLPDGGTTAGDGPAIGSAAAAGSGDLAIGRVDINTATLEELQALPGIGPATAAAIIAKREADGPFRSVDSLIEVRGIGPVKLDGMRELVTAGR